MLRKKSETDNLSKVKKTREKHKVKAENIPAIKIEEPPQCYIHEEVKSYKVGEVDEIREKVCVKESDYPIKKYTDGKNYCLFHLPSKNKDIAEFNKIFQTRLNLVRQNVAEFEVSPENAQEQTKDKLSYDFRYVWFPSYIDLSKHKIFEVETDFNSATFFGGVSFAATTFFDVANFSKAIFRKSVDFGLATFSSHINFSSTEFFETVSFRSATFSRYTLFSFAKFNDETRFDSAIFSEDATIDFYMATFAATTFFNRINFKAETRFFSTVFTHNTYFDSAVFSETSQVFFTYTKFYKTVNFKHTIFLGYVIFEGAKGSIVFLENRKLLGIKKRLEKKLDEKLAILDVGAKLNDVNSQFDNNEENSNAVLNLQNARLEKPERISFHRVRLCPSWFVNTDSRKMVFTDISWSNLKSNFRNKNIKAELESLKERWINAPHSLLEIACRQLAVNAEENNRYDDASGFRKMANESKRLKDWWGFKIWSLHWWYWLSSFYGESWLRALGVLLGILLSFTIYYHFAFFQICPKNSDDKTKCVVRTMQIDEAIEQSLYTAAFQNIEYRKTLTSGENMMILLEKILAPIQAALLALAIRRKFMR